MNTTIYQHPNTVSDLSVDPSGSGRIATSCFDGNVRLFAGPSPGAPLVTELRASQLQCVALRSGIIASDEDIAGGLKEGVAVDVGLSIIHGSNFNTQTRILDIDPSGRYGVGVDQSAYDRLLGTHWTVIPATAGFDKWPMAIRTSFGAIIIGDQTGRINFWHEDSLTLINSWAAPAPVINLDVNADGTRVVVADENRGLSVFTRSGVLLKRVVELSLVHAVCWLPNNYLVYGTHDGRLCLWDGISDLVFATAPATSPTGSKPKRK